ncbi:MAG: PAS domain S-box protein [Rhodocyclaceae bacterium]|nr:PAS domain S-box protein [Rhodocyclaceae bacterium]
MEPFALWHSFRNSLRFRITFAILLLFLLTMTVLWYGIAYGLRTDLERPLAQQQESAAMALATRIDDALTVRMNALYSVAAGLRNSVDNPALLKGDLANLHILNQLFQAGVIAYSTQGQPVARLRAGVEEVSHLAEALVPQMPGKLSLIGAPFQTQNGKTLLLPMAVRILDRTDAPGGILVGLIDLNNERFISGPVSEPIGKTGGFLIISPQDKLILAATDPTRAMKPAPPPGVNPMHDRYMRGFEGSGVAVNSRGIEELSAARGIPATGWFAVAVLPTKEAFAPIARLNQRITLTILTLSVLVCILSWWFLNRQLKQFALAAHELSALTPGGRLTLPDRASDEFGQIVIGFNRVLARAEESARALELTTKREALTSAFKEISDLVPGVIYRVGVAGNGRTFVEFISSRVRDFYCVAPDQVYADASELFSVVQLVDADRFFDAMRGAVRSRSDWSIEYAVQWPNGTRRWHLSVAHLHQGSSGNIHWDGFITDITERKKQEARLSELAMENDAILNNARVGIVHLRDRKIHTCNPSFARLYGYTRAELIGESTRVLYARAEDWESLGTEAYRIMAMASEFSTEAEFRRKDGSTFWGAVTGTAIDLENPQADAIWTLIDISDRIRSAQEAQRLMQAIEQSPVSIILTDVEGSIYYVNPRFTEVTGYTPAEVIGQNPRILQSGNTPPATYEALWSTLLEKRMWEGTLQNRRKNGELFWETAWISPLLDENGEINGFVAVKEDITEKKRTDEELAQYRLHLEELVEARTAELQHALVAAQKADQAKDAFLATVGHELRTPLSAVIGLSEIARGVCKDSALLSYFDKINGAGLTLKHLIDDLLDLSKIVAGHLEFEHIPFSLRGLLERTQSLMLARAASKGLAMHEFVDDALPDVLIGDPLRVEQILLNLLSNAIKFTDAGEIDVRIELLAEDAQRIGLLITVRDTGIGMTPEEMERVFEPFSQADASMSRRYGGSGLGLAISTRLSQMMGGRITVSSQKNQGSAFKVELWLERGKSESEAAANEGAKGVQLPAGYRGVHLLLVEDQPLNQEIVEGMLAAIGITPDKAGNGQEGLERLAERGARAYDLVLMDVQMPVLDGLSATRQLRNWPGFEALPVIAMTAHTMRHEVEDCLAAGMNDHIGKPFDSTAFYAALARWLPRTKQRPAEAPAEVATPEQNAHPARPDPGPLSIPGLDAEPAIARFGGRSERYRHWLRVFLAEGPATLAQIRLALDQGSPDEARKTAHAFKGRVGMLGMTSLHPLASELEAALHHGKPPEKLLSALESAVRGLCAHLDAWLKEEPAGSVTAPPAPTCPPAGPLPGCVASLLDLLDAGDGSSLRQLEQCLEELARTDWNLCLQHAAHHIRAFDFDAARRLLQLPLPEGVDEPIVTAQRKREPETGFDANSPVTGA